MKKKILLIGTLSTLTTASFLISCSSDNNQDKTATISLDEIKNIITDILNKVSPEKTEQKSTKQLIEDLSSSNLSYLQMLEAKSDAELEKFKNDFPDKDAEDWILLKYLNANFPKLISVFAKSETTLKRLFQLYGEDELKGKKIEELALKDLTSRQVVKDTVTFLLQAM